MQMLNNNNNINNMNSQSKITKIYFNINMIENRK